MHPQVHSLRQAFTVSFAVAEAKQDSHGDTLNGTAQPNGLSEDAQAGADQVEHRAVNGGDDQEAAVVLSEFDRKFQKAKDSPSDFNQWVAVEKLLDKEVRSTFDRLEETHRLQLTGTWLHSYDGIFRVWSHTNCWQS